GRELESAEAGRNSCHLRRHHWVRCPRRSAVLVLTAIGAAGFVHGDDGGAPRSSKTRVCGEAEARGGLDLSAPRNPSGARIPGKEPDVWQGGTEPLRLPGMEPHSAVEQSDK